MSDQVLTQKAAKKKARPMTQGAKKEKRTGVEIYVLRTSAGKVLNLKASASSTAIMDKTVERYSKAMKRLAKR